MHNKLDINYLSMTATSDSELGDRPSPKLKLPMGGYKWLLVLPLVLVPVVWLVGSRTEPTETVEAAQVLPVETTVLAASNSYQTRRSYTGELVARRSSDLGFERAGKVVELVVDEGDFVEAGAPIARLDVRDLEVQRQQLEAQKRQVLAQLQELEAGPRGEDIASAQAAVSDLSNQLQLARLQEQRRAELYEKGAVSREEWDERRFGANAIADRLAQAQSQLVELQNGTRQEQVAAQVAQVDRIDAQIEAIDISLDKSVLTAPFAGEISQRAVDEGAVVGNGQTVVSLVENGAVEAKIGVPTDVARRLSIGESQSVKVGDRSYLAVVSAKLPALESNSQTVTVVLALEGGAQVVMGETARLEIEQTQKAAGYWLPSTALIAGDRGLWSVYVLGDRVSAERVSAERVSARYEVKRRDVEVLYTEGGAQAGNAERAFVRGLVEGGDRVIASGTQRVVDGQIVTIAGD